MKKLIYFFIALYYLILLQSCKFSDNKQLENTSCNCMDLTNDSINQIIQSFEKNQQFSQSTKFISTKPYFELRYLDHKHVFLDCGNTEYFCKKNDANQYIAYLNYNTPYPEHDTILDVNFDGYKDYLISYGNPTANYLYNIFLYNNSKDEYEFLESPLRDPMYFSNISLDAKEKCLKTFFWEYSFSGLDTHKLYFTKNIITKMLKCEVQDRSTEDDSTFVESIYTYNSAKDTTWQPIYKDKILFRGRDSAELFMKPKWSAEKNIIISKTKKDGRNLYIQ